MIAQLEYLKNSVESKQNMSVENWDQQVTMTRIDDNREEERNKGNERYTDSKSDNKIRHDIEGGPVLSTADKRKGNIALFIAQFWWRINVAALALWTEWEV